MDIGEGLFAGEMIKRSDIVRLGIEYEYDEKTGWDWRVYCRVYAKATLYESQPTLRDAMFRLHQLTAPSE